MDAPGTGGRCSLPAAAMAVVGIAGVAVVVAFTSPGVIVGISKDVVPVEVEAAPMVPPLIRRAPCEAMVCSTGRPGAAIDAAINGRAAVARGATAPMVPLLRSRKARADPVGIVFLEITLVGNAASV